MCIGAAADRGSAVDAVDAVDAVAARVSVQSNATHLKHKPAVVVQHHFNDVPNSTISYLLLSLYTLSLGPFTCLYYRLHSTDHPRKYILLLFFHDSERLYFLFYEFISIQLYFSALCMYKFKSKYTFKYNDVTRITNFNVFNIRFDKTIVCDQQIRII